jgi:hypothetical protein
LNEPSTTPNGTDEAVEFTVTHPFHPLRGQQFGLLAERIAWGEPRVFFLDPTSGRVRSLPRCWTSLAPLDAFLQLSTGRAILRLTDLQALVDLVREMTKTRPGSAL